MLGNARLVRPQTINAEARMTRGSRAVNEELPSAGGRGGGGGGGRDGAGCPGLRLQGDKFGQIQTYREI
jgi:hypothetical protein